LLLVFGLVFSLTATLYAKRPNPAEENIVNLGQSDVLSSPGHNPYIEFGAALPAYFYTSYTNTVPEELTIGLRDCCIRDDVVEVYVDGSHVGTVDSRNGPWGSHPWEYITVSLWTIGTHPLVFKNTISGVGPSGWYYSLSAVPLIKIDYVKVFPDSAYVCVKGQQQFVVKGYGFGENGIKDGDPDPETYEPAGDDTGPVDIEATWATSVASEVGTINKNTGLFTAGTSPGIGTVTATYTRADGEVLSDDADIAVFGGEITGPSELLIYCEGKAPNIHLKAAKNQPEGVTYKWEIISGSDKIGFVGGTTGASITVKGIKKSAARLDVEVKLNYMLGTKTCYDTHKLTVRKPTSLDYSVGDQINHYHPDGSLFWYERYVTFTLKDQFGDTLAISGIPIEQTITVVEGMRGRPVIGRAHTNEDGQFSDHISSRTPIPPNYYRKTYQVITAGGCDVGHFYHIFTATEVTVTRAP